MKLIRNLFGKDSRKRLYLTTVYILRFVLSGVLWIVFGAVRLYERTLIARLSSSEAAGNSIVKLLNAVSAVLMFTVIACICFSFIVKHEPEDQLSHDHLLSASAITLYGVGLILMILTCISAFFTLPDVSLTVCLPFMIGVLLLSVGLIWLCLEKVWEDTES